MSADRSTDMTEHAKRELQRAEDADDITRLEVLEGLNRELEEALEADGEAGQTGH
jgi:hypothetical protein